MRNFFILAIVVATSCFSIASENQEDGNIETAFAKYGVCIQDRRGLKSFLVGLKYRPEGEKLVNTIVAFGGALNKEIQTIREIPHAYDLLNEIRTVMTATNIPMDRRMINPDTLVDFQCVLQTTLDLLQNDRSFQDLMTTFSRPAQVEAFKRLEVSKEAQNLSKLLRNAGVDVDSIIEMVHEVIAPVKRSYATQVQRFASAIYKGFGCPCPSCTACLHCCLVEKYM